MEDTERQDEEENSEEIQTATPELKKKLGFDPDEEGAFTEEDIKRGKEMLAKLKGFAPDDEVEDKPKD